MKEFEQKLIQIPQEATLSTKTFSNITIRNNYLEDIAGDGIVLSEAKSGGVVEGNVAVRMCNADYGTQKLRGRLGNVCR